MKDQTCCFTGHRRIPAGDYEALKKRLAAEIVDLIHQGVRYFGAGGARGFDTIAAQAMLTLRESQADKVVYTSERYERGCMQKRNQHLVDNSAVCVCYLNGLKSGTVYTVDYARQNGLRIINLA